MRHSVSPSIAGAPSTWRAALPKALYASLADYRALLGASPQIALAPECFSAVLAGTR
jgi:hypothetical protein